MYSEGLLGCCYELPMFRASMVELLKAVVARLLMLIIAVNPEPEMDPRDEWARQAEEGDLQGMVGLWNS